MFIGGNRTFLPSTAAYVLREGGSSARSAQAQHLCCTQEWSVLSAQTFPTWSTSCASVQVESSHVQTMQPGRNWDAVNVTTNPHADAHASQDSFSDCHTAVPAPKPLIDANHAASKRKGRTVELAVVRAYRSAAPTGSLSLSLSLSVTVTGDIRTTELEPAGPHA